MDNLIKKKVSTAEVVVSFLEKRFVTGISSFVFGGVVIAIVFLIFVVPNKNDRINELEKDRDEWKSLYLRSPANMLDIYRMFDNVKNNKIELIEEETIISKDIQNIQENVEKSNKELEKLKSKLK